MASASSYQQLYTSAAASSTRECLANPVRSEFFNSLKDVYEMSYSSTRDTYLDTDLSSKHIFIKPRGGETGNDNVYLPDGNSLANGANFTLYLSTAESGHTVTLIASGTSGMYINLQYGATGGAGETVGNNSAIAMKQVLLSSTRSANNTAYGSGVYDAVLKCVDVGNRWLVTGYTVRAPTFTQLS